MRIQDPIAATIPRVAITTRLDPKAPTMAVVMGNQLRRWNLRHESHALKKSCKAATLGLSPDGSQSGAWTYPPILPPRETTGEMVRSKRSPTTGAESG